MIFFWCPLLPSKNNSNVPNVLHTMFRNNHWFKNKFIFLTLMLVMPPMHFSMPLVSSNIVSRAFNLQPLGTHYDLKKQFSCLT